MKVVYSEAVQSQLDFIDIQIQSICDRATSNIEALSKNTLCNEREIQREIEIAKNDMLICGEVRAKVLATAVPRYVVTLEEAKQAGLYKEEHNG